MTRKMALPSRQSFEDGDVIYRPLLDEKMDMIEG